MTIPTMLRSLLAASLALAIAALSRPARASP